MPLPLYFRGPQAGLPNRGRMLVGRPRIELRDCASTCPRERRQRGWGPGRSTHQVEGITFDVQSLSLELERNRSAN